MNRRRLSVLFTIVTAVLVMAIPVQAAEGVQISLTADREELTVGDPVQLTLEVKHPAGTQVIIPKLEPAWGDFEVRNQSQATTTANDDGTETTRQTIEVTLFNLGDFETPSLSLTVSDSAGQVSEAAVPAVSLTVTPTLAEEDSELRDIKPQAGLATPPIWPWIAGGLLAAVGFAVAGWWAYRHWQGKPFGLAPAVDNRPPWQVAYDELDRIEGLGLLEQGRFKEHYTLATDCLRTYLEGQFHLRVFDRTTTELKPVLRGSDLAADHTRRFLDLFFESDLVKFAKFTPDIETARQLTAEARLMVDLTRPEPESEAQAEDQQPGQPVTRPQLSYQSGH